MKKLFWILSFICVALFVGVLILRLVSSTEANGFKFIALVITIISSVLALFLLKKANSKICSTPRIYAYLTAFVNGAFLGYFMFSSLHSFFVCGVIYLALVIFLDIKYSLFSAIKEL